MEAERGRPSLTRTTQAKKIMDILHWSTHEDNLVHSDHTGDLSFRHAMSTQHKMPEDQQCSSHHLLGYLRAKWLEMPSLVPHLPFTRPEGTFAQLTPCSSPKQRAVCHSQLLPTETSERLKNKKNTQSFQRFRGLLATQALLKEESQNNHNDHPVSTPCCVQGRQPQVKPVPLPCHDTSPPHGATPAPPAAVH